LDCLAAIPFLATKYTNELQSMGYINFICFMNSELDYFKFYKILPEKKLLSQQAAGLSGEST
jgi:hypothetical protein